jgi:hypothetical protein
MCPTSWCCWSSIGARTLKNKKAQKLAATNPFQTKMRLLMEDFDFSSATSFLGVATRFTVLLRPFLPSFLPSFWLCFLMQAAGCDLSLQMTVSWNEVGPTKLQRLEAAFSHHAPNDGEIRAACWCSRLPALVLQPAFSAERI